MSEYEALLAGLRIAKKLGVRQIKIHVDSQLVANQVNDQFEAKEPNMATYLKVTKQLLGEFEKWTIEQIPRSMNKKADALSKLASLTFDRLTQKVLVKVLNHPSIEQQEIHAVEEETRSWMDPIIQYQKNKRLPIDKLDARKIEAISPSYKMINNTLYKKSFLGPLLRCIGPNEANYIIREVHERSCGIHARPRTIMAKIMNLRYYWSTMYQDVTNEVRKCQACQMHAPLSHVPKHPLVPVTSGWPFSKWAMDIVGPFPVARGGVKFLIVAIEYFRKWIEAKPLVTITGKKVLTFTWENIVCRFGLPHEIVTDNRKQFADNAFKEWCMEMKVIQTFKSVYYPQANGQVERANRSILKGLKKKLTTERQAWTDHLPNVLWSHRTTPKSSNGETPYSLVYGSEAVIPAEIGMLTLRTSSHDEATNEEQLRMNLDIIQERREMAQIRQAEYKKNMEGYYNKRVHMKQFKVGDYVWRKNEARRKEQQGKLGVNWEGPYKVTTAHRNGSYELSTIDGKQIPRTWNGSNLKLCYI